jgi:hypothetical protein
VWQQQTVPQWCDPVRHATINKIRAEIIMMKTKSLLAIAGLGVAMCLAASQGLAQDNGGAGGGGGGGGGGFGGGRGGRGGGGGNFDPAQFQERMMQGIRDRLEVTDDQEWTAIQPLVQKVMDARMSGMAGMGRGFMGPGGGRQRGGNGGGDNPGGGGGNGGQRRGGFPGAEPSPAAEALQKAIDAKASNNELKSAIAKFVEERKTKQADLEKAQADLRKVLSTRQEAIASLNGLL